MCVEFYVRYLKGWLLCNFGRSVIYIPFSVQEGEVLEVMNHALTTV